MDFKNSILYGLIHFENVLDFIRALALKVMILFYFYTRTYTHTVLTPTKASLQAHV